MKLLIANRGEIAVRIARTARRLGLATVGVYSEPDRDALHVDVVDQAVALGGSSPTDSYLRGEAMIAAATRTGATAIHPGYGFLAENADFAQAVIDAGLTWVGPTPSQIRLLGDKIAAKQAALAAGVPTTSVVALQDDDIPAELPEFPLLVKAAAGGGGRGMRIAISADTLAAAIAAARREAAAAFGDDTVFVEPYIERGRHIEVQIFGDSHGNVVHLGDRECSIQRRNQKVIEEAPAAGIDDDTRQRLHDGAVALARHAGYVGAGTVEFMVGEEIDDGAGRAPTITFLEMNTRLQVEHPVTEAITGLDLVELQLLVADGAALPFTQADIEFCGHAIEVRLVAEDPAANWLPSTGTVTHFDIDTAAVRVDTGIRAGSEISSEYDSLLAKLIAHHEQRAVAAARIATALRTARIVGVTTNADMAVATLAEPDFLAARTATSYLDEHPEVLTAHRLTSDDYHALVVASTLFVAYRDQLANPVTGFAPIGWRNLATQGQRVSWSDGHTETDVEYGPVTTAGGDPTVRCKIGLAPVANDDGSLPDDTRRELDVRVLAKKIDAVAGQLAVEVNGLRSLVRLASDPQHGRIIATSPAGSVSLEPVPRFADHDLVAVGAGPVSPLPGTVLAVSVEVGQAVTAGDLMVVVEAMKMEHQITAATNGVVSAVHFAVGERVNSGDLLIELDTSEPSTVEPPTSGTS